MTWLVFSEDEHANCTRSRSRAFRPEVRKEETPCSFETSPSRGAGPSLPGIPRERNSSNVHYRNDTPAPYDWRWWSHPAGYRIATDGTGSTRDVDRGLPQHPRG